MKGLKNLGLFWQLCVERYRQLAPHERQAISEALGEALAPAPVDRFSSAVKVVALLPAQGGGWVGWKTRQNHGLPSTILQRGEQPLEALHRLLKALGPFEKDMSVAMPVGLPRLDAHGQLVVAFRFQEGISSDELAQANRRHLVQGRPDVLVAIPKGALYECGVDADLVGPVTEATLKENSLAFAG